MRWGEVTLRRAIITKPMRCTLKVRVKQSYTSGRCYPVQTQTYEITFLGRASTALRAEFDDCEITLGPGTTTLRAELPDRGALSGLIERVNGLGLDVIDVTLAVPPAGPLPDAGNDVQAGARTGQHQRAWTAVAERSSSKGQLTGVTGRRWPPSGCGSSVRPSSFCRSRRSRAWPCSACCRERPHGAGSIAGPRTPRDWSAA